MSALEAVTSVGPSLGLNSEALAFNPDSASGLSSATSACARGLGHRSSVPCRDLHCGTQDGLVICWLRLAAHIDHRSHLSNSSIASHTVTSDHARGRVCCMV